MRTEHTFQCNNFSVLRFRALGNKFLFERQIVVTSHELAFCYDKSLESGVVFPWCYGILLNGSVYGIVILCVVNLILLYQRLDILRELKDV